MSQQVTPPLPEQNRWMKGPIPQFSQAPYYQPYLPPPAETWPTESGYVSPATTTQPRIDPVQPRVDSSIWTVLGQIMVDIAELKTLLLQSKTPDSPETPPEETTTPGIPQEPAGQNSPSEGTTNTVGGVKTPSSDPPVDSQGGS